MYHSSCPNTGSNPGGGRTLKKKVFLQFNQYYLDDISAINNYSDYQRTSLYYMTNRPAHRSAPKTNSIFVYSENHFSFLRMPFTSFLTKSVAAKSLSTPSLISPSFQGGPINFQKGNFLKHTPFSKFYKIKGSYKSSRGGLDR